MMEEKKNESRKVINYILVFFVGCLVMYAVVYFFPTSITESVIKEQRNVTINDTGIAEAVSKVYDSVVVVSTYKNEAYYASGTGFVYKNDNGTYYILTNHHVIEGGNKVTVTFTDGSVMETKVVGSDQYSDIAVLSLKSDKDIKVVDLGSSEDAKLGDTTFAIGAPLDSAYSWTVTRGIISGKDRMVEVSVGSNGSGNNYVMKVTQTDAAINSGNSGGPLCNANGEVIGITSLKLVKSGVEGMGFAIPIEDATLKAEEIISGNEVEYPYLGVSMLDIAQAYYTYQYYDLIKSTGLSSGVIVAKVEKGSASDEAGLKENDIITKIDDKEVKNAAYLKYYLYQYKVGDTVKVKVNRSGKEVELKIKLGSNKQTT